jgi:hypothetical protein
MTSGYNIFITIVSDLADKYHPHQVGKVLN